MSIDQNKYIKSTSGVGADASVPRKDPILRVLSNNPLIPTKTVKNFSKPVELATYFGTDSEEYKRASFYFGFLSKSVTVANKISFHKYNAVDSNALIYGGKTQKVLTDFNTISDASFDLEIADVTHTVITDLTTATSLSDIASLIQTQVQSETESQFSTATVSFNAARGSFDFVSGDTGTASIGIAQSLSGTSIVDLLEWNSTAIFSDGLDSQTITENLNTSIDIDNNFTTFLFTPAFSIDSKVEVAQWTQLQNFRYMFVTSTSYAQAQAHYDALNLYGGVCVTIESNVDGQYHEMIPASIAATTDYTKPNSVKNYMYQPFAGATPTITTTEQSNFLDSIKINYYGQTQASGQELSFYQKGFLMGGSTSAQYINVFINESWFKSSISSELLNLQIALEQIPYNAIGVAQVTTVIQSVIDEALNNGVISANKPLTTTQILYIGQISNDENAYRQVQSIGYWLDVSLASKVENSVTIYSIDYTLIYAKSDSVSVINGTQVLI